MSIRSRFFSFNGNRSVLRYRVLLLIFSCCFSMQQVLAAQSLHLEPQANLPLIRLELSADDLTWLQTRRVIRLGVSEHDYGPLSILRKHKLKGLMADYLSIITSSLGLTVEIQTYPDGQSALQALRAGKVDVLGSGSSYEAQLPGLLLSAPYSVNQPVLVGRDESIAGRLLNARSKMAMVDGYAPIDELHSRFPNVQLQPYSSVREALHAVEYKHADWAVCDAVTVAYQMGLGELPNLRMRPLTGVQAPGYSFVFRADDALLVTLFNRVLAQVPQVTQADILSNWGGSPRFDSLRATPYTPEQIRWLVTRPEVRVVVNGALPPYSFFDDDGNFSGLVADLLYEVGLRSGLRFKVIERSTATESLDMLADGEADLSPIVLLTADLQASSNYTEPFATSSFALVGVRGITPNSLADPQIQQVSLTRGSPIIAWLHKQYPHIQIHEADSPLESLVAVANHDVDAAIVLLPLARYLINQYFAKTLSVVTSLPEHQAGLAFAVAKDQALLLGVIEATFDQFEPRMVNNLLERWQGSRPAISHIWGSYERRLHWAVLIAASVLGVLLIWFVYTVYRRIQSRTEQARQAFRGALLDGLPQPVVMRDVTGAFVLCNDAFYEVFGLQPSDVIGRKWEEVKGLEGAQVNVQAHDYETLLRDNEPDMRQVELKIRGEVRSYRQWTVPHKDINGRSVGLLMGWIDMSKTERLLRQLQDMRDQAVQASEAKSRFLAVMSHEIRTPLNAIIGLLELTLARVDKNEPWDRPSIEVAYSSSRALMLLIGDILDLSKIESGKLVLEPQRNSPKEILQSVERVFQGLARQKGLYLETDLQLESENEAWIDGGRLKQVLSNLVSNAIKFTDRGGIRVSLYTRQVEAELQMTFIVEDSGIGISSDNLQKLFQPFSQVHEQASARGGTGLGLVICQQLVEMMQGDLQLASTPEQGTRITVTLSAPALSASHPEPRPLLTNKRSTLRVLLVDDHPANRLLLGQQLVFLGHTVKEAEDGQQGFALVEAETFDVVITDCDMPVMDGYEFTRHLREEERHSGRAPRFIVGFTANAQESERQRCLAVGMDDCLFKPVSLDMLRACLEKASVDPLLTMTKINSTESSATTIFDLDMFNSLTGSDPKLARLLLDSLYTNNCQDLQRFDEHLSAKRWFDLARVVHRVRGAARMVGAQGLIEAAKVYEEGLRQELTEQEATLRAIQVRTAIERLQEAVAGYMNA
ncbi:transporter substrate-binding domain-containing protein [Pseudomonas sp. Sample_16]|uniref:ATP-binding protein n=1 Tax=Pseudomonas sp. Sample_16 TaxID=2448263 RepID=UPI001032FD65|nr:transporter substrate-binding domain-containing protein [Pseudomonas sp. Sample_16]